MVKIKYKFIKNHFEKESWAENCLVCGVDEVGRGCLAGPLVTAAVVLNKGKTSSLLQDSKILDENELQKAFAWICKNGIFSYSVVSHRVVDQQNIYQATLISMAKSVNQLMMSAKPHLKYVLVDSMPLEIFGVEVRSFDKGESKSSSIAAASIVAKVQRDRIMQRFGKIFPAYKLESNKGYGTKAHWNALVLNNKSIIHRLSFLGNLETKDESAEYEKQGMLF
ncbi:MAG: ribonuclease HII (RNase HII) [candidate division TM6 bacterium GW2011_GWF2_32_72]|nr:MAG: ribonuclease HII (RNase HII) [candidate division TM6 bacterium GW2011_GWF2_32_72]